MRPVSYSRAADPGDAVATVSREPGTAFLAGGTTLVDLLRIYTVQPHHLVDINDLALSGLEDLDGGGIRIGALARMSEVARSPTVVDRYPMISEALLSGASPQLRNMASMAGNLMQRVRCGYFRDVAASCNKRVPGSGCSARNGINRTHAVLGTSEHCIATHPSDVAVPLVALDAVVRTEGPNGRRAIPIDDFFLLPGDTPEREHPLAHGELVTAIDVPALPLARTSRYLKVRDRASYEFALASVAVAMATDNGTVSQVRVALGGVGTKPWRARQAERVLTGAPATRESFADAARAEMAAAVSHGMNEFKIELARRTIVRALETVTDGGVGV